MNLPMEKRPLKTRSRIGKGEVNQRRRKNSSPFVFRYSVKCAVFFKELQEKYFPPF